MKRITKKRVKNDDDEKSEEKEEAYIQYITEVMSAMVFYENPKVDLVKLLPTIHEAAALTHKLGQTFEQV